MQIGFIGLGKMGMEMATIAINGGHKLIGYDCSETAVAEAGKRGLPVALSLEVLLEQLQRPRILWLQLPPGCFSSIIHSHRLDAQ